jgi:probable RcsB/C two-component-system connector
MHQNGYLPDTTNAFTRYVDTADLPTQQETLGEIVVDILKDGRHLNRKSLCTKLLSRLEQASTPEEERHYQMLISLLFGHE